MNYRPGIPRYLQIAESIRHELRDEGERISSEHALCARFKVSRPTIRQALEVLVQEGRLYRHAGRGTFATPVGVLIDERGTIATEVAQGVDQILALWNRVHNSQPEEGMPVMS